ncbi:MAG: rhodanese-like domain-containing protein [Verrucomicrobiaceae bacterium]|nr:rhodanese-like domain-containing protein [Verrucomicrobiaceae bacterium]
MIWFIIVTALAIAGWYWYEDRWDRSLFTASPGHICTNMQASQANQWLLDHPETQVLDVRSLEEFANGALPAAVNISIGDPRFDEKVASLARERPVLVYCAGGYRSRKAVAKLKDLGFKNIQHIHRGYMSWRASGGSNARD